MQLFPFQQAGAEFLASGSVRLLADEMGLGKTAQTIRATEFDPDRPVNVIGPAILAEEWREEWARWHDYPRSVAVIGERRGVDPYKADVVIASYNRASKEQIADVLTYRKRRGAHLVCDEAQFLKEPESIRTQSILGLNADGQGGIASAAGSVWFLTGTPAPNCVAELYPMLATAGAVDGMSYWAFAHRYGYVRQTPYGAKPEGLREAKRDELRQILHTIMLRRTNAVELPPTDYGELIVDASDIEGADLSQLRRLDAGAAAVIERAAKKEDFSTLETPHIAQLRRLTGLAKVGEVTKRAAELLTTDPTAKIVLFCMHKTVIDGFVSGLRDFGPVKLAGGDSDKKRKKLKDQFQADPETRIAVCQMKAAGAGLTLTAANHLWIVEPSWTPADNDQACKRIVRIGQKRRTEVNFVTLAGSIDHAVNGVLRKKRNLIDQIIN